MATSANDDFLIDDAFQHLVEAAITNQETINQSAESLAATAEELRKQTNILPGRIAHDVERSAVAAANSAARQLTDRLVAVVDAAERARKTYEDAVRFSFRWIAWQAAMATFFGIAAMVVTAWFFIPSANKMQALREDKAWLESNIARLADLGGRAHLTTCEDNGRSRRCIRTDEAANKTWGQGGQTFRIIHGY